MLTEDIGVGVSTPPNPMQMVGMAAFTHAHRVQSVFCWMWLGEAVRGWEEAETLPRTVDAQRPAF
ncbi:hypothetical protein KCP75_01580 [Salmonella enterica subsp. enterica]|nr:hypothetical protein KCP75_01580 [Salmonella enterica subsp. enterica]